MRQNPCPNSRSEPSITSSLAHIKGTSKERCLLFVWSCVDTDLRPLPKQYGSDAELLLKSTRSKPKGWKTPSLLNPARNLLKKDWFIFFFQRKTHEKRIPSPKRSVVHRQVQRAKHLLVHEWSGTIPVRENRRKPPWAVYTLASSIYLLLDIHSPVSIPP